MGLKRSQIKLPFLTPLQDARRKEPEVGSAGAFLPCRVPTVGLHAKGVYLHAAKRFAAHADKPALRAAKQLYATLIPLLARPLAPPLRLHVEFVLEPPAGCDRFDGARLYTGKPDRSNLVKVFEDALRRAGWMHDDALVVEHPGMKWVSFDRELQGVWFRLETLAPDPLRFRLPFAPPADFAPLRLLRFPPPASAADHV